MTVMSVNSVRQMAKADTAGYMLCNSALEVQMEVICFR